MHDTELYVRILTKIESHDRQSPITGKALGELFGISERKVQAIVRDLRLAGRKVAASMGTPMGYYLATGPEDMIETAEMIRLRAREGFALANQLMDFGTSDVTLWEQPVEAA